MRRNKRGLSLIEIVVISFVIIVVAVIVIPIVIRFIGPIESPRETTCISNQRQIVALLQMYTQDHNNLLPLSNSIWPDIKTDPGVLICPVVKNLPIGYLYNNKIAGVNITKIEDPTAIFTTVDGETISNGNIYYSPVDVQYRHSNSANASFADGHVSTVSKTATNLPWDLPVKMKVEKPVVKPTVKKKTRDSK